MKRIALSGMFVFAAVFASGCEATVVIGPDDCLIDEVWDPVTETCVVDTCDIDPVTGFCETSIVVSWPVADCPPNNDVAIAVTDNDTGLSSPIVDVACSDGSLEFLVAHGATFDVGLKSYDTTYTNLIYGDSGVVTTALINEGDLYVIDDAIVWNYGSVIADWDLNGQPAASECNATEDALLSITDDDAELYVYGLACSLGALEQFLPVDPLDYFGSLDIVDANEDTVVVAPFEDTLVIDADNVQYDMGFVDFTTL